MKKLTKKQVEIMKIFWASEHPLAASDILKLDESMNINTIRASIQSLLKADYIEVAGIEHRGNVLARTYTSKIKIEEYIISNFAGITFISFFTISNSRCPLSVFNKTSEHPLSSELKFASVFSYPQKSAIVISLGHTNVEA